MTHDVIPITVAYGDGVGPEILEATLHILQEAGAPLVVESIEIGEHIYKQGAKDGLLPSAWPQLARTGILLKGPIIMPKSKLIEPLHVAISRQMQLESSEWLDASTPALSSQRRLGFPNQAHHANKIPAFAGMTKAIATKGKHFAMFTTTEDAAPKLAGKDTANPSTMLHAACMMLDHIGKQNLAARIYDAWKTTLSDGIHTRDIKDKTTKEVVGTEDFANAVVARYRHPRRYEP